MRKAIVAVSTVAMAMAGCLVTSGSAGAFTALPCDPKGVPAADAWNAGQLAPRLDGRMRGGLSAYRISCARVVTEVVRSRGLPIRAAEIAITTIIPEASMDNLDGGDGSSVGLFQQTVSSYPNIDRNDPVAATHAFLNEMLRIYPNGSWASRPVGEVCQAVQRSAFPERYQPEAHDGALIANAVWDRSPANMAVYRPGNGTFYIRALDGTLLNTVAFPGAGAGDVPAVGHYENSNYDNLAVYRRSEGTFHIRWSGGRVDPIPFGQKDDLPAVGRFENGPYDNLAVFRPSNGTFYIREADGDVRPVPFQGAGPGDLPAVGHYENSNYDNLAIYRPSVGAFFVRWANGKIDRIDYGQANDRPASGHFEAGRYTNLAVYRQGASSFHIRNADNSTTPVPFGDGRQGDVPAVGKFQ